MFDQEIKNTLANIEELTITTVAPFVASDVFNDGPQYGYKRCENENRCTTYLVFSHEDRVLLYGVDFPKGNFLMPVLATSDKTPDELMEMLSSQCELFAQKGIVANEDLEDIITAEEDGEMTGLTTIIPNENETDMDFFTRNAMWLLNPIVH